jgi:hypothetical protein
MKIVFELNYPPPVDLYRKPIWIDDKEHTCVGLSQASVFRDDKLRYDLTITTKENEVNK